MVINNRKQNRIIKLKWKKLINNKKYKIKNRKWDFETSIKKFTNFFKLKQSKITRTIV